MQLEVEREGYKLGVLKQKLPGVMLHGQSAVNKANATRPSLVVDKVHG